MLIYFSTCAKKKELFNVKTNYCPCNNRKTHKDVGAIDVLVIYNVDDITAVR